MYFFFTNALHLILTMSSSSSLFLFSDTHCLHNLFSFGTPKCWYLDFKILVTYMVRATCKRLAKFSKRYFSEVNLVLNILYQLNSGNSDMFVCHVWISQPIECLLKWIRKSQLFTALWQSFATYKKLYKISKGHFLVN